MESTYLAFSGFARKAEKTSISSLRTTSLWGLMAEEPRSKNTPSDRMMLPLSPMLTLEESPMTSTMLSLILLRIERRSTAMVCIWLRMATISSLAAAR